ncbi:MAG: cyclic pyranopterin monophosphate synthase MoaC [Acidimicrobiia bacterium]|nr:MAG: cyclic pyranopterin monophosphate synthase MoaC [Acidimicrobiia bacterium]
MNEFNHLDDHGNVHMVDVGGKQISVRVAVAEAFVSMQDVTAEKLFADELEKGDALATVRIAAIQATKRTPDLIPLCHPLSIDRVEVSIEPVDIGARIEVLVGVEARTGVEMEAMTGAAVGALALYDMVKGIDRSASVEAIRLLSKSGGESGDWERG